MIETCICIGRPFARSAFRVYVLDASFNPPTRAHLALARLTTVENIEKHQLTGASARPGNAPSEHHDGVNEEELASEGVPACNNLIKDDEEGDIPRLLLLSARNADKTLVPGDATLAQRLRMMVLLAQGIGADTTTGSISGLGRTHTLTGTRLGNVAVALIDAPTFVTKASILRSSLEARLSALSLSSPSSSIHPTNTNVLDNSSIPLASSSIPPPPVTPSHTTQSISSSPSPSIALTFIMGFDTIARVFAPRYYPPGTSTAMYTALDQFFQPPPAGDGAAVICAWRGSNSTGPGEPEEMDEVKKTLKMVEPYSKAGHVSFASLTDWEMLLSSSAVRAERRKGGEAWLDMVPGSVAEFIRQNELYSYTPLYSEHTL